MPFFLQMLCFGMVTAFVFISAQADAGVKIIGSFFVSAILFMVTNLRYVYMKQSFEKTQKAKADSLLCLCHDLRTRLTTVCGIAEIFEGAQSNLDSRQKQLIRTLSSSTTALKMLITEYFDSSGVERKAPDAERGLPTRLMELFTFAGDV